MRFALNGGGALVGALLLAAAVAPRAQVRVSGPMVHEVDAETGALIEGSVPLVNPSEADRTVRLYLTDYAFDASGSTRYDPPGTLGRSAAPWIEVGADRVVVPAGGRAEARYRIRVPDDRSLDGTRWCVLMVEDVTAAAEGPGLRRRVRYGVQIALQFGAADPDLAIADVGVTEAPSSRVLWVDLANGGGGTADTEVSLELFDEGGASKGRLGGSRARLYPDTSFRHRIPLEDVPSGRYVALLIVETGDEHAVGSQFTLEL